jgi:uncharacterized membrane protein
MTLAHVDPSLMRGVTAAAYALHIGAGTFGMLSGLVAILSRKGERLHRAAGKVFTVSMLVMALFAFVLAAMGHGPKENLIIAVFVFYLVGTAWLTVARPEGAAGLAEKIAFVVALGLCAPFGFIAWRLATGQAKFGFEIIVALSILSSVTALAALSDLRLVLAGGIAGAARIARHLWRMCLGLTMAVGSFTTQAVPKILPWHPPVTGVFFMPQLVMLGLLVFWLLQARLTRRFKPAANPA